MRVFIRGRGQKKYVVVWEESDCKRCFCGQDSCNWSCDHGYLPPNEGLPFKRFSFKLTLPVDAHGNGGEYDYFAHGSYNLAYKSANGKRVLKRPIDESYATDSPERMVRVWNLINPNFPAQVIYNVARESVAWVAPFIKGVEPTQAEIAQKILEIYEKTGRIVADAFVTSNFIKVENGSIVCIDVGAAFFLESRSDLKRIHSKVSLESWQEGSEEKSRRPMSLVYRDTFARRYRDSVIIKVTKALLYLQMHRPDCRHVSVMGENATLINSLAWGYDENAKTPEQLIKNLDELLVQGGVASVSGLHAQDDTDKHNVDSTYGHYRELKTESHDNADKLIRAEDFSPLEAQATQSQPAVPVAWLGQQPPRYPGLFACCFNALPVSASHTELSRPNINDL